MYIHIHIYIYISDQIRCPLDPGRSKKTRIAGHDACCVDTPRLGGTGRAGARRVLGNHSLKIIYTKVRQGAAVT